MTLGVPPAQTYRLRWNNDSSTGIDLSEEFRNLRENAEFFDVALSCSVTNGGSLSLRAHKVILTAYSAVFREMFRQNTTRSEPFVYLKGVSFSNLSNLLDFMYNGQANVSQANLSSFLALAEDLQIKGLQLNNKSDSSATKPVSKRPTTDSTKKEVKRQKIENVNKFIKTESLKNDDEENEEYQTVEKYMKEEHLKNGEEDWIHEMDQEIKGYKKLGNELLKELSDSGSLGANPINIGETLGKKPKEKSAKHSTKRGDLKTIEENDDDDDNNEPVPEDKVGIVEEFIKNLTKHKLEANKKRTMARCRICLKEYRRDKIKGHVKVSHPEYIVESIPKQEMLSSPTNDDFDIGRGIQEDSD